MKFTVYSKDGCPYCTKIKMVLELANLETTIYNLDVDYTKAEFYNKFGDGSTFPQVICDGKYLGGCSKAIEYLRENKIF